MEYCSRGTLYDFLSSKDLNFGWEQTLKYAIETTMALECLHTWNPPVFHRDVKSLNYLIDEAWHIKISLSTSIQ